MLWEVDVVQKASRILIEEVEGESTGWSGLQFVAKGISISSSSSYGGGSGSLLSNSRASTESLGEVLEQVRGRPHGYI